MASGPPARAVSGGRRERRSSGRLSLDVYCLALAACVAASPLDRHDASSILQEPVDSALPDAEDMPISRHGLASKEKWNRIRVPPHAPGVTFENCSIAAGVPEKERRKATVIDLSATVSAAIAVDANDRGHVAVPLPSLGELQDGCPPTNYVRPSKTREDLGRELRRLGLTGVGVEVGVQEGRYTESLLRSWRQAELYVQVDVWKRQENYEDDANVHDWIQWSLMEKSCNAGVNMMQQGYAKKVVQCKDFSVNCATHFADGSLDFVYLDARHDRKGLLEDLRAYWPKLKVGGVMAGHDYTEQHEPGGIGDPAYYGADWTLNYDGTYDTSGRVVRGAVDDFFSGEGPDSLEELRLCPRQPVVTYREDRLNTWTVRK